MKSNIDSNIRKINHFQILKLLHQIIFLSIVRPGGGLKSCILLEF